jgi:hypothetical protein
MSSKFWRPFPLVLMGATATSAGLLALLFPETTGDRLPENMEDALNLGKNYKGSLFGCRKVKRQDGYDPSSEVKTSQEYDSHSASTDLSKSI